jgi:actin-like ATPase involved in cell morphogenesis
MQVVPDGRVFGLDAQTLISIGIQLFNAIILALALGFILYNPVKDFLRKRSEKIQKQIDDSDAAMMKAKELIAEYEAKIKDIDKERLEILEAARLKASEESKKILQEAKGEEDEIENKEDEIAEEMEIRGRDIVSGLPIKITITSDEIREALIESINSIVNAIRRVLERTPPELSSDIYTNGIYLSGGGALLKGLDIFIEKETGIKVYIAENPLQSVALGAGKICENL